MRNYILSAAAVSALALLTTQVNAATVVFDDFSITQLTEDEPNVGAVNTSSVPFGAGTRTLTAENLTNSGNALGATSLDSVGGLLAFSNDDLATGIGTVTYTAVGDIALAANPFFFFDVGAFDNIAQFLATATDTFGNVGTYTEVLAPGFNPKLFFSQFSGSVDFNSVDTLSFSISTNGGPNSVDGSLDGINISAIPLPAGGLLLLTGFGALAALGRKKAL